MRDVATGQLPAPPISATLGYALEKTDYGRVVYSLVPGPEHYNPYGSVHGGVYATLLDAAAGGAVQSTLKEGYEYTTLDLAVKFLRPMTLETGKVQAVGTVIHRGRRTALAQAELQDEAGRLFGFAISSCLIFSAHDLIEQG
ncbi:PaaI family thioesterase [Streptomyces sp. NPDC055709]